MDIVGGFDVHRKQITFDYIEMETGEIHRGKIQPATRQSLRSWLQQLSERFPTQDAAIAVEATTGWRYVVEERDLLVIDRLPESWVPPEHIQEIRTLMRLRHSMVEERTCYQQRIHAQLFHNGYPQERNLLFRPEARAPTETGASRGGPQGSGALIEDDRPYKRGARAHRDRVANLRPFSGRLPGADGPLRYRRAYQRCHARRARRHQALFEFQESGAPCRHRRHRTQLRREAVGRQAQPAGTASIEVGSLRGGPERQPQKLTRSSVLRSNQRGAGRKPGSPLSSPQATAVGTPYSTRVRRGGHE